MVMKIKDIVAETVLPDGTRFKLRPFYPGEASVIADIYEYGLYDQLNLREGETVFDIGAHIGAFTVKASKIVGKKGRVISFEPHPENFGLLKENIEINNCSNVIPFQAALFHKKGKYELSLSGISIAHSLVIERGWGWGEGILVNCSTIDAIMKETVFDELKENRIDAIKIDAEGAEKLLLEGGANAIASFRPKIAVAAYHTPAQELEITEYLETIGYETKRVSTRASIYRTAQNFVPIIYGYP